MAGFFDESMQENDIYHFCRTFFLYICPESVTEDIQVFIRWCTYILLVALTLQSFYRSIMTVEYQIHLPDYIAKCINKDRPQLHCNGQCVLMKKIEEKEKKDAQKNLVVYEYSSLYVHNAQVTFTMPEPQGQTSQSHFSPYLIDYRFNYHASIFRPPVS